MDVIYCFGDNFSYRTPARDYEQFPIEEAKKKLQGERSGSKQITQLTSRELRLQRRPVI